MFKKITLALSIAATSTTAIAGDWVVGGDYISVGSINAVAASGHYVIPMSQENQKLLVGGRYGIGISDDDGVELDSLMGVTAKYQFDFGNNWYIQGIVAYTQFDYSVEFNFLGETYSASDDDSEFSIGVGGGYQFNDNSAIEFAYEDFDYDGALSVGYRYSF